MIDFFYNTDYQLVESKKYARWISKIIASEEGHVGEVDYVFCDDAELLSMNQKYLKHDTLTDIITFDYTEGSTVSGDIFISIDRVRENATIFKVKFESELHRVMAHGILHLLGYGDKVEDEIAVMRRKEEEKMKLFHVEQ